MKKFSKVSLSVCTFLTSYAGVAHASDAFTTSLITDTSSLEIPAMRGGSDEVLAQQAATAVGKNLLNNCNNCVLALTDIKESLTAKHFTFSQMIDEVPVSRATITVSIDSKSGEIVRIYHNIIDAQPAAAMQRGIEGLSVTSAAEIAFNVVASSELLSIKPLVQEVYYPFDGELVLSYQVDLTFESNTKRVVIGKLSGEVLDIQETEHTNHLGEDEHAHDEVDFTNRRQVVTFEEAMQALAERPVVQERTANRGVQVDGKAFVFDPDPRTTLEDTTISFKTNKAVLNSTLASAYKTVTLQDITKDGNTYRLAGPWVEIVDVMQPSSKFTAKGMTTSSDGNWFHTRDEQGFQDANVYYHIDQSQRYLQSLGYVGGNGIQNRPIKVDTDSYDNRNAFYTPRTNMITFGHQGTLSKATEDATIILHEYGHAIMYDINPNWSQFEGDMGAIGEGFGDYWGATYKYATENGKSFHPERMGAWFWWDKGQFGGRQLDRTGAEYQYKSGRNYEAHGTGQIGDQMWATPLFQAHVELRERGIARDQIDKIVIESQFGLGGHVTMPIMAQSIYTTAKRLYPAGPHAEVFYKHFQNQGIVFSKNASETAKNGITVGLGERYNAKEGEVTEITAAVSDKGATFAWRQLDASEFHLLIHDKNSETLSFTADNVPEQGVEVQFELVVTSSNNKQTRKVITVFIHDENTSTSESVFASSSASPATSSGDSGGSMFFILSLLAVIETRRLQVERANVKAA
ncbi:M36 family metallopeptidase [Algicola sagamiensis]|uniref:M36 family metallopeptidase n=1 Tax=Algicola sagamiensis TaxID=163869 RepID=UPI0003740400|nr:M36 family metallopeptidase [Algicola sagamiensis]